MNNIRITKNNSLPFPFLHLAVANPNHWPALEVLKALCVLVILFVHPHFLLITEGYALVRPQSRVVQLTEELMVLGVFITMLPIMAGSVIRMGLGNLAGNAHVKSAYLKRAVFSALFIAFLGFCMNGLTWGGWYFWSWNMLQTVAVSYVLCVLIFFAAGVYGLFFISMLLIFLAQPLASVVGVESDNYFLNVLFGSDSRFTFWPLFPWAAMPLIGFLYAHFYLKYSDKLQFWLLVLMIGGLLVGYSVYKGQFTAPLNSDYVWTQLMIQPSLGEVAGAVGLFSLCMFFLEQLTVKMKNRRYGMINCFSKGILWIYLLQMIASYHLAPWIKQTLTFKSRMELITLADMVAYAVFPVTMVVFGWVVGALIVKLIHSQRYRITIRKV